MTTTASITRPTGPTFSQVERLIHRRSFCTLSTVSASERPHSAGVLYAYADGALYVSTDRESRKARNIAANPAVFMVIPVRRLPVGPPSSVQFAAEAEILGDEEIRRIAAQGSIKAITGHGELDREAGCFLRITPGPLMHTYGIGMSLIRLIRDPLNAAGQVRRPDR